MSYRTLLLILVLAVFLTAWIALPWPVAMASCITVPNGCGHHQAVIEVWLRYPQCLWSGLWIT